MCVWLSWFVCIFFFSFCFHSRVGFWAMHCASATTALLFHRPDANSTLCQPFRIKTEVAACYTQRVNAYISNRIKLRYIPRFAVCVCVFCAPSSECALFFSQPSLASAYAGIFECAEPTKFLRYLASGGLRGEKQCGRITRKWKYMYVHLALWLTKYSHMHNLYFVFTPGMHTAPYNF